MGPGSGRRGQEKLPAGISYDVAQDPQTEVTLFGVREQIGGVESDTVVTDRKDGMALREFQAHLDVRGSGVLRNVVQALLGNPVDESFPGGVKTGVRPNLERHGSPPGAEGGYQIG